MNRNQTTFRRTLPAIGLLVLATVVFAAVSWQESANASGAVTGPSPTPAASLSPIPTPSPTCMGVDRYWHHFSNREPIVPADRVSNDPGSAPGLPANYPSTINVWGDDIPSTCVIGGIAIDFALTSERPDDLDILIVDPQGRKSLVISDAGGNTPLTGIGYLFMGGALFPDETAPPAGYYYGANYAGLAGLEPEGVDNFPTVGGTGQYTVDFQNLLPAGWINPGSWKLYVVDDETNHLSSLPQGWRVSFYRMCSQPGGCVIIPTPTPPSPTPTPTPTPPCEPGTLDPSFDGDGKVTTGVLVYDDARAVAIQPDGKIVTAGSAQTNDSKWVFGLVRYNDDGSLDTSFDTDGKVTTDILSPDADDFAYAVAIQADGKIVTAGSSDGGYFALVRYNPDGSLDTSFGEDGIVTTSLVGVASHAYSVAIQPDGKILAGGASGDTNGNVDFAIFRYNGDGSLDTSFGTDGKVTTAVLSRDDRALSVAIQPDGKIVLAGESNNGSDYDFAVVRYNSDGSLDTSFDGDGKVTTGVLSSNDAGREVAIQPDGKLVTAGSSYNGMNFDFAMVRYNSDGSLDMSFDADGKLTTDFLGNPSCFVCHDSADAVVIQADGRIVAAGESYNGSYDDIAVARYNIDGSLDMSFDGDGKVTTGILNAGDHAYSAAIQPDGKIVAAGTSYNDSSGAGDFALVRYGTPCTTPTPTPTPTPSPFPEYDLTVEQSETPDPVLVGGNLYYSITVTIHPTALGGSASPIVRFGFPTGVPFTFVQAGGTHLYSAMPDASGVTFWGGVISTSGTGPGSATLSVVIRPKATGTLTSTGSNVIVDPANLYYESNESNNTAQTIQTSVRRAPFDHDGDGRTDYSVFRPSNGAWYLWQSLSGFKGVQFGVESDKLTPADYDGDGKADIAVYRPSTGTWYIVRSSNGTIDYPVFGAAEDVPVPGDYDGDGKADLTVFRPSIGGATWYRVNSSNGSFFALQFGGSNDRPTVGDFDGDGKADIGIWRPPSGSWYHIRSSNGSLFGERFGISSDKIAPADYDGDGKTDIAIWRPSTGLWVVRNSATSTYSYSVFGSSSDIPVAGDYDGDGKADIGVWRPADGTWYVQRSSNGSFLVFPWGQNGDVPTPGAFGN